MSTLETLMERSGHCCELCKSSESLSVYEVTPAEQSDNQIVICQTCADQIQQSALDSNHWRCLSDSMWNQVAAVQVMAWRLLNRLKAEAWAQDLLD
ncbi:MAG: PhnA domain protein, partial [Gammaproteobacteria bacterium CG22_combo_CG10-13_8_21_14_all_40_8]